MFTFAKKSNFFSWVDQCENPVFWTTFTFGHRSLRSMYFFTWTKYKLDRHAVRGCVRDAGLFLLYFALISLLM